MGVNITNGTTEADMTVGPIPTEPLLRFAGQFSTGNMTIDLSGILCTSDRDIAAASFQNWKYFGKI